MKRSGSKYTTSHTTVIESAALLADRAHSNLLVTKISLGIIKSLPGSKGGTVRRIKFTQEPACLLAKVRGNRAIQEIRFFSNNVPQLEKELRKEARSLGFEIS
jgi:hypothetical protein